MSRLRPNLRCDSSSCGIDRPQLLVLARGLVRARDLARDRALQIDLLPRHNPSGNCLRDLARDLDRDLDRLLGLDGGLDLDLDLELGRDVELGRRLARNLVRDLGRARDIRALRDLDEARHIAHQVVVAIEEAAAQARAADDGRRHASAAGRPPARPVRLATCLTRTVIRVLPSAERPRYREEFRSELHVLVAADASRWGQVAYAIRLLDRAWVLRAELREAVASKAWS